MPKVMWVMSYRFYSKLYTLSSSVKFWKSVKTWQSYREFKGGNFFETQCIVWSCRSPVWIERSDQRQKNLAPDRSPDAPDLPQNTETAWYCPGDVYRHWGIEYSCYSGYSAQLYRRYALATYLIRFSATGWACHVLCFCWFVGAIVACSYEGRGEVAIPRPL